MKKLGRTNPSLWDTLVRLHHTHNLGWSLTRQRRVPWWAERTGVQPMRKFDNNYQKGKR